MKIGRVQAFLLKNIPITPPPFRNQPSVEEAIIVRIETVDGCVGWSMAGHAHPIIVDFINAYVAPVLVGENSLLTERVGILLHRNFRESMLGRMLLTVASTIDIALWDLRGKAFGMPVHHLLGGARDTVPVYITHGAAYGTAPPYSPEELAAEALYLIGLGNTVLKSVVGRQPTPDPDDDFRRMAAVRAAVGPDTKLAVDANSRMSVPDAVRLCNLCADLDIAFFEEPIYENDPRRLAELKAKTGIPIAVGQNFKFSALDLLLHDAADIIQPNVNNDGGYTGGTKVAALAKAFNKVVSHGNGSGPHNIALQAGLSNGTLVEYHFHKWMAYNAIFEEVPQPENGQLAVSQRPGLGLDPKPGLISEYAVR